MEVAEEIKVFLTPKFEQLREDKPTKMKHSTNVIQKRRVSKGSRLFKSNLGLVV